ncbi:ATP-binding protein [Tropicibacter sp. S64]|uniref:ATP-binding protein n=1 Tax=Tropicibacter sp. S64 TaxID=3415122 RepID=UPI003C7A7407
MSVAPDPHGREATPLDLIGWAEAVLSGADTPLPQVERLSHAIAVLALPEGSDAVAGLLFGLWAAPQPCPPVTMGTLVRAFGPEAAQVREAMALWGLIREMPLAGVSALGIALDESFADWLLGGSGLPPLHAGRFMMCPESPTLPDWPVSELAARIVEDAAPTTVCLTGPRGAGARALVGQIGAALGVRPICVDAEGLDGEGLAALARVAERQALLSLCPLFWTSGPRPDLPLPTRFPLCFQRDTGGADSTRRIIHRMGPLSPEAARVLWSEGESLPSEALTEIARDRAQTPAQIARARATLPRTLADARQALHAARHGDLPPWLTADNANLSWEDIVLPERVLAPMRSFCHEVRMASALWENPDRARHFPRGRGTLALLSGSSGTGKTMAAQVMARDLGMDLYRVDAGALTSKYVGETAQHLQAVLDRAEADGAMLFFDECDGLFGKRVETRDAQDRYQNADTNVLLAAVERYEGAAILATNKRENIDGAFTRRLRYAVDLPRPDAAARLQMWGLFLSALSPCGGAGCAALAGPMASRLDLTGAQIRNVVLTAVVEAMRRGEDAIAPPVLLDALDQELTKESRALSVQDREALLRHG